MARTRRPEVREKDLQGFKYFDRLMPLLDRLHDVGTARDKASNRQLFYEQYALLMLLFFFNPILTSVRGLQQASALAKVQELLGVSRVSLGAFSEAAGVFDAEPLRHIVQELAAGAVPLQHRRDADPAYLGHRRIIHLELAPEAELSEAYEWWEFIQLN